MRCVNLNDIYYFDHAATTYVKAEVFGEMLPFLKESFGNPSSAYGLGRKSKKYIEEARKKVANLLGCGHKEVFFTGSGTESNNMSLKGVASANKSKGNHIITSKIEHPAILNTCKALEKEDFEVTYLDVDENGIVKMEDLKKAILDRTILISIMFANNEIGSIQPVKEIGEIAKSKRNIFSH